MPRDSKAAYTSKQKRKAEHIEESYEKQPGLTLRSFPRSA